VVVYPSWRYANFGFTAVETIMPFLLKRDNLKVKYSVALLELDEEYVLVAISMLLHCKFVLQEVI
jgi:hypothetical protein